MGGEKFVDESHFYKNLGSPPHGRGKELSTLPVIFLFRITPALAGKSGRSHHLGQHVRDHPRMGGEKISMSSTVFFWQGSPPRGRGKVHCNGAEGVGRGITPALAGKRGKCGVKLAVVKDHPRVGGEKSRLQSLAERRVGSPPRWRGKAFLLRRAFRVAGITPAWAGKSSASQPWSPPLWMMVIRPRP